MRIRVLGKSASVAGLFVTVLIGWLWYDLLDRHHATVQVRPPSFTNSADALQSTNAPLILAAADHFFWLNNAPAAAPLYTRAEMLFSENRDKKNELHAHIGRLRCEAEHMSFVDLSHYLEAQLQTPIVAQDKRLRLWCLIWKGYTDIELDYHVAKRDWLEALEIAKSLGEDEWATRASGELGRFES